MVVNKGTALVLLSALNVAMYSNFFPEGFFKDKVDWLAKSPIEKYEMYLEDRGRTEAHLNCYGDSICSKVSFSSNGSEYKLRCRGDEGKLTHVYFNAQGEDERGYVLDSGIGVKLDVASFGGDGGGRSFEVAALYREDFGVLDEGEQDYVRRGIEFCIENT